MQKHKVKLQKSETHHKTSYQKTSTANSGHSANLASKKLKSLEFLQPKINIQYKCWRVDCLNQSSREHVLTESSV